MPETNKNSKEQSIKNYIGFRNNTIKFLKIISI